MSFVLRSVEKHKPEWIFSYAHQIIMFAEDFSQTSNITYQVKKTTRKKINCPCEYDKPSEWQRIQMHRALNQN